MGDETGEGSGIENDRVERVACAMFTEDMRMRRATWSPSNKPEDAPQCKACTSGLWAHISDELRQHWRQLARAAVDELVSTRELSADTARYCEECGVDPIDHASWCKRGKR